MVYYQPVYMAENEYDRGRLMDKIAESILAAPENEGKTMIVCVHEHAGWFLDYAMVDGMPRIVGTANDQVAFPPEVRAWSATIRAGMTLEGAYEFSTEWLGDSPAQVRFVDTGTY